MSRRGFSLIEIMVTLSVVALTFLLLLNVLPSTLASVRQSEHRLAALALIQNILDHCRAGPFSDIAVDGTYTLSNPGPMLTGINTTLDDGVELQPLVSVLTPPATTPPIPRSMLALVRVTVTWREKSGPQKLAQELEISCVAR